MATEDAFGAGFEPGEATIDADDLDRGHAYALHHAIHEVRAMKIPNKRRLATAGSAHLNPLREGFLRGACTIFKLYLTTARATSDEVSLAMRPTDAPPNVVTGMRPNKLPKTMFEIGVQCSR